MWSNGSVFVEKLLRVQPNVKHLFLPLRALDPTSAAQRLHSEVLGKEVFSVLRTKYGVGFNSFISAKVTAVAGDIALKNFGLTDDSNLLKKLLKEVDVVAHFAATAKFDERYDVVLETNTIGAKNVLEFAKKCVNLEMFVHISTAYVCGEKSGVVLEKPFKMGETLNTTTNVLDMEEELKLAQKRLNELMAAQVSEKEEKDAMGVFGMQRARLFGWPNTYVFTKAMGEMLIGKLGENVPHVIIRPTIVTGTYKEPFPGWSEDVRTVNGFILASAKGKLPCYPGNVETIIDMVPGDMVVNATIVAMVVHANLHKSSTNNQFIYQVCSSKADHVNSDRVMNSVYKYFSKNPLIGKNGKPIQAVNPVRFPTMNSFRRYVFFKCELPLKVLEFVNVALLQYISDTCKDVERRINQMSRMIELNEPYLFFKGQFDDANTERLRMLVKMNQVDQDTFYFDPKSIDWDDYLMNIHISGLVKYVIRI
ncbi:fatty acyl-CoA reductase 3-like isoform X2 [Papaver somniferum]|uniref:fatty acyl-CoA reductase 3-like isoform X2 n=1 Tax=Papaver somniferum TaxID=3469 RepID=UPI000E704E67|nr:fatty acyl-CoA reductase 3-like isoform X2 [Papaver somniferum]